MFIEKYKLLPSGDTLVLKTSPTFRLIELLSPIPSL